MKPICTLLTFGTLGWLWLMLIIIASLIGIAASVLWIWMLIEILTKETDEGNTRLIWALVIIFTHWLGAIIYLLVRREERLKKLGR